MRPVASSGCALRTSRLWARQHSRSLVGVGRGLHEADRVFRTFLLLPLINRTNPCRVLQSAQVSLSEEISKRGVLAVIRTRSVARAQGGRTTWHFRRRR